MGCDRIKIGVQIPLFLITLEIGLAAIQLREQPYIRISVEHGKRGKLKFGTAPGYLISDL